MKNITIVSACDRNFLWGAYLLAASAARFLPQTPVHILQTGFTDDDKTLLEQFPTVKVLPLADDDPRNVANRKSEALLSADTDFVAWLDADCMVVGDISKYLIPKNGEFQIRMRGAAENTWVWRNHYAAGEPRGGLPKSVLEKWRTDVGQRKKPLVDSACVTNCFVLHKRHLEFVRQWKSQIAKVIPPTHAGVVDNRLPAYFMVDESVMTSLLALSNIAPTPGEFLLDRDPQAHVAHFGANPKPWIQWRLRLWYCHAHIMSLLDWAKASGYKTPPIPWSFEKKNRVPAYLKALLIETKARVRSAGGNLLRIFGIKK
jgi:hypothetical protein